jgi:hypothetical protein
MSCKWCDVCPLRSLEQHGLIDLKWRNRYCDTEGNWKECKRYQMEEDGIFHALNMMPDGSFVEEN